MNNKTTATLNATETAEWNSKWVRLLEQFVSYPCVSVLVVSFSLSLSCWTAWLALPGIVMLAYGILYLLFIRSYTSAAWKNWVSRNRKSSDLPKGLWRAHSQIHTVFLRRQKAFLRGTFALSIISYLGAFIVCEWAYPGITDMSEIVPAAAMLRMIIWSVVTIILALWISYIITHQKWARDDAWDKADQEALNTAEVDQF